MRYPGFIAAGFFFAFLAISSLTTLAEPVSPAPSPTPENRNSFATAITCVDGTIRKTVTQWIEQRYYVKYVDLVTELGPDEYLTSANEEDQQDVREAVKSSVIAHNSSVVCVVGHFSCPFNVTTRKRHLEEIAQAVAIVQSWHLPVEVKGLYVNKQGKVEEVP